jgi:hypothetical protein
MSAGDLAVPECTARIRPAARTPDRYVRHAPEPDIIAMHLMWADKWLRREAAGGMMEAADIMVEVVERTSLRAF